ncbi:MAG: hypothetical protein AAGG01_24675 [Planctomycetota bacterium]
MVVRVALWCAPGSAPSRLLGSFDARPDCVVSDEPLAPLLTHTSQPHAELIQDPQGWTRAIEELTGNPPQSAGKSEVPRVWIQKHSASHLLLDKGRDWLVGFRHAFVIRDAHVLLASAVEEGSYAPLEATGIPHQLELYRWLRGAGKEPVVICWDALIRWREELLPELCRRLGLPFDRSMLDALSAEATPSAASVERSLRQVPSTTLRSCEAMFAELLERAICGPLVAMG